MEHNTYLYIAVLAITCYLIRVLPLTLIRKPITNVFVQSFLYYVPYVTLAVMTFPAILTATASPVARARCRDHHRLEGRQPLPGCLRLLWDRAGTGILYLKTIGKPAAETRSFRQRVLFEV